MMITGKKHETFEVNICENSGISYTFTKGLRRIRKMKSNEWKHLAYGYDMNGYWRVFHVNKDVDMEVMIRCILGEITVENIRIIK